MDPTMATLPTLPRRSWLERSSLLLAIGLVLLGASGLAGWWLHLDALVQPLPGFAPITANASLCIFLLGVALLGQELAVPLLVVAGAGVPALISALTLVEYVVPTDFKIDEHSSSSALPVSPMETRAKKSAPHSRMKQ